MREHVAAARALERPGGVVRLLVPDEASARREWRVADAACKRHYGCCAATATTATATAAYAATTTAATIVIIAVVVVVHNRVCSFLGPHTTPARQTVPSLSDTT